MIEFQHIQQHLQRLEADVSLSDPASVLNELRLLGLNDFLAVLWEMPQSDFPRLSSLLPPMASLEVQSSWTGSSGEVLLNQSVAFARAASANYLDITGSSLRNKLILDFGCGYGRLLRAFSFFTEQLYGVDPWPESIRLCHEAGLMKNVLLSDYLPESLPVPQDFDFVFAFSVFTHLSERATSLALRTIRQHMKEAGVLCITIRPIEYWRVVHRQQPDAFHERVEAAHASDGFAFHPHYRDPVDGDITYGDTSMTLDYLTSVVGGLFSIAHIDRSGDDLLQRYVYLKAI